ncbi:ATP-binding protein, partial [Planktotalea sp.]|uniref:AAA family ATPase n=1 Tax=Planktotalea sp. TaxID=2029877 RepID=UPI0032991A02
MPHQTHRLHMICGKIASGKSTLTADLAKRDNAIVLSEDAWLQTLYSDQLSSIADFVRCTQKIRQVVAPMVVSMLNAGSSVVLDFQANTVQSRKWMRGILEQTKAQNKLHILDVPDDICLARLRVRNAKGEHPFAVSEELFWQFSQHMA